MLRKSSNFRRLIFNSSNRVDRFFENGIFIKFHKDFLLVLMSPIKNSKGIELKLKIFDNVDDYINEYTSTSDVGLANYQRLFLFFFLFCVLILFVFVFNCLIVHLYPAFILFRLIIVRLLL